MQIESLIIMNSIMWASTGKYTSYKIDVGSITINLILHLLDEMVHLLSAILVPTLYPFKLQ